MSELGTPQVVPRVYIMRQVGFDAHLVMKIILSRGTQNHKERETGRTSGPGRPQVDLCVYIKGNHSMVATGTGYGEGGVM